MQLAELVPMRQRKMEPERRSPRRHDEESQGLLGGGTARQRSPGGSPPASPPATPADVRARCRPGLAYVVFAIFFVSPALEAAHLPAFAWKLILAGALLLIAHRIFVFKRWADETPQVKRFIACILLMIVELLWENIMVWIVSATDRRKYEDPPGLQDNGEIALTWLGELAPPLRWFFWWRWCNVMHFLGAVLCLAFSVAWDQHPFSGFGVMSRFCITICLSRIVRVASFMATVLPSPRPGCYSRRFPPPPDTLAGLLRVGLTQLRGFGGCNDLVFSGHGAFWAMGPLMFQAYYPNRATTALLWLALAQTSARDVLERQHYSVDMLLAPVVTAAVWTWCERAYPQSRPLAKRAADAPADALNPFVLGVIVAGVSVAAIVVFVAKA